MPQEFPTIYRAKNLQEAQLLCNLLDEEGIRATLTNGVLENGSGVDIVGWPTLARVMVAEGDAVRARDIALKFDREVSGGGGDMRQSSERNAADAEVVDVWPCCPECGERRMTRCTICGTSGSDFPPADANAGDLLGLPTPPAGAFSSCSCGPGGCGSHGVEVEGDHASAGENDEAGPTDDQLSETPSAPLLICPTCDEPFHPQYLRRCEWCGHDFPDGLDFLPNKERKSEPMGSNLKLFLVVIVCGYLILTFFMANGDNTKFVVLLALFLIILEAFWLLSKRNSNDEDNDSKEG